MLRFLLKLCLGLILMLLLSLTLLVSTQMGLKITIGLAERFSDHNLQIGDAHGRLIHQITLTDLRYQDETSQLTIDSLQLTWQPFDLLQGQLIVKKFAAKKIDYIEITAAEQESSVNFLALLEKINLRITDFVIETLQLQLSSYTEAIVIDNIALNLTKQAQNWQLFPLTIQAYQQCMTLEGHIAFTPDQPINLQGTITSLDTTQDNAQGTLSLTGTMSDYKFMIHAELLGDILPIHRLDIMGSGNENGLSMQIENIHLLEGQIAGHLNLTWLPYPSWQIEIQATQLNPHKVWTQFPDSEFTFSVINDGNYVDDQLQTRLQLTHLAGHIENMPLNGQVDLMYNGEALTISDTQLSLGNNQLYIAGHLTEHTQEADLNWEVLIADLSPWVTDYQGEIHITGSATGTLQQPTITSKIKLARLQFVEAISIDNELTFNATLQQNQRNWTGQANLSIAPIKIKTQLNETPQHFTLNGGKIDLALDDPGLSVDAQLQLSTNNQLTLNLNMPQYQSSQAFTNEQPINAQLTGQIQDLNTLLALAPDIDQVKGQLQIDLNLTGTIAQPQIQGGLTLRDAAMHVIPLNITLEPINFTLSAEQLDKLTINGNLQSGSGELMMQGEIKLQPNFVYEASLTGSNLQIINTDEYKATIAPTLTLSGHDEKLQIRGDILIPNATIAPIDFSGVVALPEETVYTRQTETEPKTMIDLDTDIQIILGDAVNLKVMGLTARMEGQLEVIEQAQQYPRAFGELNIVDGRYTAYGQSLVIERGRIIYSGGLIDNPTLDIRASRTISGSSAFTSLSGVGAIPTQGNIVVGIQISGDAYDPMISLFSRPDDLSDGDILSFLILGQPLEQTAQGLDGTDSSELLIGAISALNIQGTQAGQALDQVQETFGLDEFGFATESQYDSDTNKVSRSAAFVIGKAITPKLFISYSIDILRKNADIFRIKYLLSQRWFVQTETDGTDNAVDVFYTIVRD